MIVLWDAQEMIYIEKDKFILNKQLIFLCILVAKMYLTQKQMESSYFFQKL